MLDPRDLYQIDTATWDLMTGGGPVLIVQLDGFIDAGQAGKLFSQNLLDQLDNQVLVDFDHDQLHDYRSRRPMMDYDSDHWASYRSPRLRLHRVLDADGTVFLLLQGVEPDVQWERTAAAVLELADRLDVGPTITLTGIPGAVPHTRPVALNAHGTDPRLVGDVQSWFGKAEVQASFMAMLEFRLGERGKQAAGFEAFVPHYLSQAGFPQASLVLTQRIAQSTGLALPTAALEESAAANMAEIAEEVAGTGEAQQMVQQLEEQYDTLRDERSGMGFPQPTSEDLAAVPSADEIGAAFERFLAERDDSDDADDSDADDSDDAGDNDDADNDDADNDDADDSDEDDGPGADEPGDRP